MRFKHPVYLLPTDLTVFMVYPNTLNPQNHSAASARLKSVNFMDTLWEIVNSSAMKKSVTYAYSVSTYTRMSSQKWRTHIMSMTQKSRPND